MKRLNGDLRKSGLIAIGLGVIGSMLFVGLVGIPFLLDLNDGGKPGKEPSDILSYGEKLVLNLEQKESNILAVLIVGNSSEIVYPELGYASFVAIPDGKLNVTAYFIDDSQGPLNVTTYYENFTASIIDVEYMNNALYTGLNITVVSNDSIADIMGNMGFGIDVLYKDGTWAQLYTIQDEKGHVIHLNGTYTGSLDLEALPFYFGGIQRDENFLNGMLLEPTTALDGLVDAMNQVFSAHIA